MLSRGAYASNTFDLMIYLLFRGYFVSYFFFLSFFIRYLTLSFSIFVFLPYSAAQPTPFQYKLTIAFCPFPCCLSIAIDAQIYTLTPFANIVRQSIDYTPHWQQHFSKPPGGQYLCRKSTSGWTVANVFYGAGRSPMRQKYVQLLSRAACGRCNRYLSDRLYFFTCIKKVAI